MKRLFLALASTCIMTLSAHSQEIFKEVNRIMHHAEAVKNDKSKSLVDRKIASFKADAIYYLIAKASEDGKFSEYELGKQTNAMIEFVNSFTKRWLANPKKADKERLILQFKNASLNNRLFNDADRSMVDAYVNNNKYITQFSVDTNWVKAYEAIK